jgi:hypothetical protein
VLKGDGLRVASWEAGNFFQMKVRDQFGNAIRTGGLPLVSADTASTGDCPDCALSVFVKGAGEIEAVVDHEDGCYSVSYHLHSYPL